MKSLLFFIIGYLILCKLGWQNSDTMVFTVLVLAVFIEPIAAILNRKV